ncbi:MAG: hypothetical protein IT555_09720 [Acetobacteraceae bacterium]|nr:hypothetical protein [Acetobacteraceae bacterium]
MTTALTDTSVRLAEIRALNRHLVSAQDAKILKVVAMVDALPDRGAADSLIAPLRPRLAQLRPSRPLSVTRLMFIPLDPVVVQATDWRRGALTIPRTALPCLARQFIALDPTLSDSVAAEVADATTDDLGVIRRAGGRLWPRAASLLAAAPPPADWAAATSLTAADHRAIRDSVVLALTHAPAIAHQLAAERPDPETIADMLKQTAATPEAMGMLITLLLHWVPTAASQVLELTSAHSSPIGLAGRTAIEKAVEHVLDAIETEQEAPQTGIAGLPRLRRSIALLDELESGSADRPMRAARIAATRARVDAACRGRFQTLLKDSVVGHLAQGLPVAPEDIVNLEVAARDIRSFEHVARRINRSDHYDRQLRAIVTGLAPQGGDDQQLRVDRLRLAEILLGPEQAMQMLMDAEKAAAAGA